MANVSHHTHVSQTRNADRSALWTIVALIGIAAIGYIAYAMMNNRNMEEMPANPTSTYGSNSMTSDPPSTRSN